jgi:hypothetical protein
MSLKAGTDAEISPEPEDAMRDYDDNEFFSTLEESERRVGLRRLDDVVRALEELNLRKAGKMPTSLKERLVDEGIPIHSNSVRELIDVVLGSQELYLLKERRNGPRRRRGRFLPSDAELVSVISHRYQR